MKRLLTYNEALALTVGKDAPFYESKLVVNGYNVSIFNYRLAMYSDFKDNDAFEMRGLTFVFNEDGSLFKRYLLLHKFFNLNQVPESQYSLVSDYVIKSIYNKEDGSVASFVKLPNGDVVGKSKMSFESEQALGMNRLYKSSSDLRRFVDWSLDNDLVAVFEYVAPHNRIVLKYSDEELILLRLRDNKTGEYLDLSDYSDKIGSIKVAPSDVGTLDELIELSQSVEDKEGWIVEFTNGLFIKVKTTWYCERHGLLTEDLYRENILVKYILDDKIDDVLGQIPEDEKEAHDRIGKIIEAVSKSVKMRVDSILEDWKVFQSLSDGKDWTGDLKDQLMRKSYALKYKKSKNFGAVMSMAKGNDVYDIVIEQISKETHRLQNARELLYSLDPTLNFKDQKIDED